MAPSILCRNCGALFIRSRPDANRQNFCSDRCRFMSKVDASGGPDACWLWTAAVNRQTGYGAFRVESGIVSTHRFAWAQANGPAPDGMQVCHSCDIRACCNPKHLFIGTQKDNMADMCRKGRHGMLGKTRPEETRAKIRLAVAAHGPRQFTPEGIARRAEAAKRMWANPASRASLTEKISKALKGRPLSEKQRAGLEPVWELRSGVPTGRKVSEETRQKIREAAYNRQRKG